MQSAVLHSRYLARPGSFISSLDIMGRVIHQELGMLGLSIPDGPWQKIIAVEQPPGVQPEEIEKQYATSQIQTKARSVVKMLSPGLLLITKQKRDIHLMKKLIVRSKTRLERCPYTDGYKEERSSNEQNSQEKYRQSFRTNNGCCCGRVRDTRGNKSWPFFRYS